MIKLNKLKISKNIFMSIKRSPTISGEPILKDLKKYIINLQILGGAQVARYAGRNSVCSIVSIHVKDALEMCVKIVPKITYT